MGTNDYLDEVIKRSRGFSIEIILNRKDYAKKKIERLENILNGTLVQMGAGVGQTAKIEEGYQIVVVAFPQKKLNYLLGEFLPTMGVKEESIRIYKDGKRLDMKDVKNKFLDV